MGAQHLDRDLPGSATLVAAERGNPGRGTAAIGRVAIGYDSLTQGEQADRTKRSYTVGGPDPALSPLDRAVEGAAASASNKASVSDLGIGPPALDVARGQAPRHHRSYRVPRPARLAQGGGFGDPLSPRHGRLAGVSSRGNGSHRILTAENGTDPDRRSFQ